MTTPDERISAQAALCRGAPRAAGPQVVLARLLLAAGRPAEAVAAAETALALDPRHATARAARKAAVQAVEALDPALAALELSAVITPHDPAIPLELGHRYVNLGQAQAAERSFKRALAIDAGFAAAHAGLGALYLSEGIEDGAEHHSRKALEADPAHAVASQTLAAILEARGDHAAAEARLDAAYARQSLFHEPAEASRMTVLVLATRSSGNIPYRHIMPPRLYSRLVWYMEHARPDQVVPPHAVVLNAIGDADLAGPSAGAVDRFAAQCARPMLNAPERVARTRRDRLAALIGDLDDVVVPGTVRIAGGPSFGQAAAHFAAPLLARPAGSHGGRGLILADTAEAAAGLDGAFAGEDVYLTRYHDYRSPDGRYRKGRMIFVDRRPYPYHWAVSDHWLVHYESAGMAGAPGRQAEERAFLRDPAAAIGPRAMAAVAAIGRRLDLDYAGLDFSVLPDGRLLVFEANATMLTHPEPEGGELAYKNLAVQAIVQAFQARLAEAAAS